MPAIENVFLALGIWAAGVTLPLFVIDMERRRGPRWATVLVGLLIVAFAASCFYYKWLFLR